MTLTQQIRNLYDKHSNDVGVPYEEFFEKAAELLQVDGSTSDGYHTFDELYDHRITLYIAFCAAQRLFTNKEVWRSKRHSDGEPAFGGTWFVLGIGSKAGEQITYHIPIERWDETNFAVTMEYAPEWDGHTSADVLERIKII